MEREREVQSSPFLFLFAHSAQCDVRALHQHEPALAGVRLALRGRADAEGDARHLRGGGGGDA